MMKPRGGWVRPVPSVPLAATVAGLVAAGSAVRVWKPEGSRSVGEDPPTAPVTADPETVRAGPGDPQAPFRNDDADRDVIQGSLDDPPEVPEDDPEREAISGSGSWDIVFGDTGTGWLSPQTGDAAVGDSASAGTEAGDP